MRKIVAATCLSALALSLTACSGRDQAANTNTTHIEAMGPEGGSNITNTLKVCVDF